MAAYSIKGIVLVPVDFSADSLTAVREAITMVADPHDLHVVTVLKAADTTGADEGMLAHLRNELDRALDSEVASGVQKHVVVGEPADEICALARVIGADTILIPAHGMDYEPNDELGTVTERVIRQARCPVLVVGRRS